MKNKISRKKPENAVKNKITYMRAKRPLPGINLPKQQQNDKKYNQHADIHRHLPPLDVNTVLNNVDKHEEHYSNEGNINTNDPYCTIGDEKRMPNLIEEIIKEQRSESQYMRPNR